MPIDRVVDITLDSDIFDRAPVSLWLRDYSGILPLFATWRAAGVRSLADHFAADSGRILDCLARVRVLRVNRYTVDLLEARSEADLIGPLLPLLSLESLDNIAIGFLRFWGGYNCYTRQTVKRSLSGRHLDVIVTGTALPGSEQSLDRVVVAVQDISGQEAVCRRLAAAERYARSLFDHSPTSLWVEDFSIIRDRFDRLRAEGVRDLSAFLDSHQGLLQDCIRDIRIVAVNDQTLRLFGAPDQAALVSRITEVFRPDTHHCFRQHLIYLWEGKLAQHHEITNFTLRGEELTLDMQFSVFPGHEDDWALVQVALTDITARKCAEAHLEYLSTRDELTGLFNRSFYVGELGRLASLRLFPLSVIIMDLNGLKRANDTLGHAAGDELLRRTGQVLREAVLPPASACRTGGDEFALLLPRTDAVGAAALLERIETLIDRDNALHPGITLRMAAGIGTALASDRMDDAIRTADARVYDAKAAFYLDPAHGGPR
jgi:diguanylate cyclase (GGDEF)-like protein